ncbi:hypothetical protein JQX13_49380 [Archangium violaceum]|uniref:hypothetical protein n=1 Tax=Archangium violaceum TaxID=83451 RepID=UPI00193C5F59|nr:hypothetical protein [Archangium violaceum]QRK14170.1 hypothetical protein JQX13_49380 [Archangium violaceum]
MGANSRSKTLPWLVAMAAIALLAVLWFVLPRHEATTQEAPPRAEKVARPVRDASPPPEPETPAPPQALAAVTTDAGVASETLSSDAPRRHPVDLAKLRERLPDNLYWELSAPTKDPQVLQKRAEEGLRWNELYGKVQSNTASEEEIHQYYEHRRRVSEDAIAFASQVLQEYGDQLPEQERGLYELSIRMHRTRLDELPRQTEDALARKRTQDQRRKEWLGSGRGN